MNSLLEGLFLFACRIGDEPKVLSAIKKKVNINTVNQEGRTGLILASIGNHKTIISLLIKNQADASIKDNYGNRMDDYINQSDHYPSERKKKHEKDELMSARQTEEDIKYSRIGASVSALSCLQFNQSKPSETIKNKERKL